MDNKLHSFNVIDQIHLMHQL